MTTNPWDIINAKSPDDTREKTYISVGSALSAWEDMELHLARMFGFFCNSQRNFPAERAYGAVVAFNSRADMLTKAAEAYFHIHPEHKMRERFSKLLKSARDYAPRRNEIAHGLVYAMRDPRGWLLMPPEYSANKHSIVVREPDGWIDIQPRYAYSSVEIEGYASHFTEIRDGLLSLMHDWGMEYDSSPVPPF